MFFHKSTVVASSRKKNNSMLLERLCPHMLSRVHFIKTFKFCLVLIVSQCNSRNGGVSLCRVAPAWICRSLERRYVSHDPRVVLLYIVSDVSVSIRISFTYNTRSYATPVSCYKLAVAQQFMSHVGRDTKI